MTQVRELMTTDIDVGEVLRLERELRAVKCMLLPEFTGDERTSRA
jgi:hypothetical protein